MSKYGFFSVLGVVLLRSLYNNFLLSAHGFWQPGGGSELAGDLPIFEPLFVETISPAPAVALLKPSNLARALLFVLLGLMIVSLVIVVIFVLAQ